MALAGARTVGGIHRNTSLLSFKQVRRIYNMPGPFLRRYLERFQHTGSQRRIPMLTVLPARRIYSAQQPNPSRFRRRLGTSLPLVCQQDGSTGDPVLDDRPR